MALQSSERARARAGSRSSRHRRDSSALGIFSQGVDSNGNPIILSDDQYQYEDFEIVKVASVVTFQKNKKEKPDEKRLSMSSQNSDRRRRGSILSLWKTGKDREGRPLVHSGDEDGVDGLETAVSADGGSPPSSPRVFDDRRSERRGSVLSMWKKGTDQEGRSIIHCGEEHDEEDNEEVAVVGEPLSRVVSTTSTVSRGRERERERHGSILSIWSQGKDKEGKNVILSGEEHDGEIPVVKVGSPLMRGQERLGSVLSIWTEGKERDGMTPAPVMLKVEEEEED
jgi:hypothetical protein